MSSITHENDRRPHNELPSRHPPSGHYGDREDQIDHMLLERRMRWQRRQRSNPASIDWTGFTPSAFSRQQEKDGSRHRASWQGSGDTLRSRRINWQRPRRMILGIVGLLSGAWSCYVLARYYKAARLGSVHYTTYPQAVTGVTPQPEGLAATEGLPAYGSEQNEEGPWPEMEVFPPSDPISFHYPPVSERRRVEPIEAYEPLRTQPSALDEWTARGILRDGLDWSRTRQHDLLITWVNGSDWEHVRALNNYAQDNVGYVDEWWKPSAAGPDESDQTSSTPASVGRKIEQRSTLDRRREATHDVGENRFREIGELRYAVRSGHAHLRDLDTIHILAPAFFPPQPFDSPLASLDDQGLRSRAPRDWPALAKKHTVLTVEDGRQQWGQVPDWLNLWHPNVQSGDANLLDEGHTGGVRLHHDWSMYTPNWLFNHSRAEASGNGWSPTTLALWKQQVLPTFNSVAVESMLGFEGMKGIRETFVYANDDMLFTAPFSSSDFATPFMGPVLRLDPSVLVRGRKLPDGSSGEWPNLIHSAWLLGRRFGKRNRAYPIHEPRTFNLHLLREMRMMWAHEWRMSGEDRFRFPSIERPGSSTHFLFSHFLIERFREALLWSFFTLKLDRNGDGNIDIEELKMLLQSLRVRNAPRTFDGLSPLDFSNVATVHMPYRTLLENASYASLLEAASLPRPLQTEYQFSAMDGGYPFVTLHPFVQEKAPPRPLGGGRESGVHQVGDEPYPRYHPREGKTRASDRRFGGQQACRIDLPACLSGFKGKAVPADGLFKRFAFDKGEECGDCLIVHLLHSSGPRGLSAFLPDHDAVFPQATGGRADAKDKAEPHLPLTTTFEKADRSDSVFEYGVAEPIVESPYSVDQPDFKAATIAASLGWSGFSKREFATQLLQRYNYVLGSVSSIFHRMEHEASTQIFLDSLAQELQDPPARPGSGPEGSEVTTAPVLASAAFLCLNDDYGSAVKPRMRRIFTKWADRAFPRAAPWELPPAMQTSVLRDEGRRVEAESSSHRANCTTPANTRTTPTGDAEPRHTRGIAFARESVA
ncbi:unnamed protein product [Parajaminaea phylloscopi]